MAFLWFYCHAAHEHKGIWLNASEYFLMYWSFSLEINNKLIVELNMYKKEQINLNLEGESAKKVLQKIAEPI